MPFASNLSFCFKHLACILVALFSFVVKVNEGTDECYIGYVGYLKEKRKYLFIRKYTQCPDFAKELL